MQHVARRPTAAAIARSTASVCSAALAPASPAGTACAIGVLARRAEAVHVDVDQPAQLPDQELDVDAGTAVDVGRKLPGQHSHSHNRTG